MSFSYDPIHLFANFLVNDVQYCLFLVESLLDNEHWVDMAIVARGQLIVVMCLLLVVKERLSPSPQVSLGEWHIHFTWTSCHKLWSNTLFTNLLNDVRISFLFPSGYYVR